MKKLLRSANILTMNAQREIIHGDLLIENSVITKIAKSIDPKMEGDVELIDFSGYLILPGFIQTHTHLCQTLARGDADDKVLLEWLKTSIWPMEAHHNAASMRASARLSIWELHRSGTTSILDMASVHNTQSLLETVAASRVRYWGGKCLMDHKERSGPLYQNTQDNLKETEELILEWKNKSPWIEYALCPRFAISCTQDLLLAVADLQKSSGLMMHTHASESLEEVELIRQETGLGNIEYLHKLGLLQKRSAIVHGVHMSDHEVELMIQSDSKLVHCPSSNLKLASGIAPVESYSKLGMTVGLGADGAPCNNNLNALIELRLAALLQKPRFGPTAMDAKRSLELLTIEGAKVLGQENHIGSLEVGKQADLVCISLDSPHLCTIENPYSAVVYSAQENDITDVMVGGEWVIRKGQSTVFDPEEIMSLARSEKKALMARISSS